MERYHLDPQRILDALSNGEARAVEAELNTAFAQPPSAEQSVQVRFCYGVYLLLRRWRIRREPDATVIPGSLSPHESNDGGAARWAAALEAIAAMLAASNAVAEGRVDDLVATVRTATRCLPSGMPWPGLRAASLLQAAYRFTGDPGLYREAIRACVSVADQVVYPQLAITARALLGSVHLLRGMYHAALDCCNAALDLARAEGMVDGNAVAMAHQFRGYVLFEWNRLEEARAALEFAWNSSTPDASGVRSGVARMLARVAAARHDAAESDLWSARLEELVAEPMTLRNREWLNAVRIRHTLGDGDRRAVEDWLQTYGYRDSIATLSDAEIHARLQELDGVLALLEHTGQWNAVHELAPRISRAVAGKRAWFEARALSAQAVAFHATGRFEEAEHTMKDALRSGEAGSFVRVYMEGNPARHTLIERLASRPDAPQRSAQLLEFSRAARQDPAAAPSLSGKQLEVLRCVMLGQSNKAIAQQLQLSLSTVKTHLRGAFRKLGVSSRTQAIAAARRTGLLHE
jgi:LuxR family maltose regulon positive regulatory protein